jgi:hypothetical protein
MKLELKINEERLKEWEREARTTEWKKTPRMDLKLILCLDIVVSQE